MPRVESITISTHDLQLVMEEIERHQISNSNVKIIDNGDHFFIRDSSDFKIGQVKKSLPAEKTKQRFQ